ncbi:DNA polymerase IV [soil metagenome]
MDTPEPILHVDMDAFYASVEAVKDPSLRGKPVIVGGQGGRGVVNSASYEARVFCVRSAMPTVTARRLCPHGLYLPNDFVAYQDFANRIRQVFLSFTPLVEPLSLDEAFLDVSGSIRLFGPPIDIARQVKAAIGDLGLASSVGVAPTKFLAKLASSTGKPDGLLVVEAARVAEFLAPLPVTALWGVGERTGEDLRRLGLRTVGDLAAVPRRTLERAVGNAVGAHLYELAHGRDDRPVVADYAAKQVSSEETFSRDLDHREEILREILRLADRNATRLRDGSVCGRTVTLKVRWSSFKTITRSATPGHEIDTAAEIYAIARDLYERVHPDRPRVRLLGVGVSGLAPGPARRQLGLLGAGREAWGDAARAMDVIRDRFGRESVTQATLLDRHDD